MLRIFLGFLLLLHTFPLVAAPFDLAGRVVEYRLENGMVWLLVRRPSVPIFAGLVMIRVGGMDEPENKTGLAHMFEHLAFKGSDAPGLTEENQVWAVLNRNGGEDLNAYTSKDVTAYYISLPSPKLPLWVYVASEIVMRSEMREFMQERDVVMEERRMRYDNSPMGTMLEAFVQLAFPTGPYHWSPIGSEEHLQSLTLEDAKAFHRKHYTPDRMVGVLVGDIDIEAAKIEIERFWGRFPKAISNIKYQISNIKNDGEKRKTISFDAEPFLLVGFHKPAPPARGDYQFDLFQGLLCGGRTSGLERVLVKEKDLATEVWCANGYPGNRQDNLFIIGAAPSKGTSLADLERGIETVVDRLKTEIQTKELERVRLQIETDFYQGLQDNHTLAERLAMAQTLLNGWQYLVRYANVVRTISKEELQKAATKYFQPENRVVLYRVKN